MDKRIIITGAGISGLSAGIYAQMNGFRTTIFEMHKIPGGLCTAWERKGYTFDISMHMLTGSHSGPFHRMWKELGIVPKFGFHYHDMANQVEARGKKLGFHTDRRKFEEEMLAISPGDRKAIRDFTKIIFGPDMMNASSLKPKELRNLSDRMKVVLAILPVIRFFVRYSRMTIQEFAQRFRDPFLREAVRFFIDSPGWPMPEFPMVAMAGFMKSSVKEAGVPLGGSQQVLFHLADLYRDLGGDLQLRQKVRKVNVENDRAVGIELEDGTFHQADELIWAADGHTLIFEMLEGRYLDERIRLMYDTWIPVKPMVHVMIGVDRDLSGEPSRLIFQPDEPITIAGREHRWLSVIHHCFDGTMAPEGKSAVEVWYDTDYAYWENLAKDKRAYREEKKRIAGYSIARLEERWPGFSSQVEVVDVPTPATYTRYTGNWQGSPDGWYVTPDNMQIMEPVRILPRLKGLYMAGQWTAPFTGTVIAAMTGRQIVQLMCKKEGKKFTTGRK